MSDRHFSDWTLTDGDDIPGPLGWVRLVRLFFSHIRVFHREPGANWLIERKRARRLGYAFRPLGFFHNDNRPRSYDHE